jgi:hypothetical protein
VSHAKAVVKAAVNAVVVARNAVMTHLRLTVAKPRSPMATHPMSVLNVQNALSSPPPQTLQRQATRPLQARMTRKNAPPANAAAVTVMVASAVNVVTVPSHRQSKPLMPTPAQKPSLPQLSWPARL